jgi:hypothetical protein
MHTAVDIWKSQDPECAGENQAAAGQQQNAAKNFQQITHE